jgi:hypothetical protein
VDEFHTRDNWFPETMKSQRWFYDRNLRGELYLARLLMDALLKHQSSARGRERGVGGDCGNNEK